MGIQINSLKLKPEHPFIKFNFNLILLMHHIYPNTPEQSIKIFILSYFSS